MDTIEAIGKDRVRKATSDHVNEKIDNQTRENIEAYSIASKEMLQARIEDLDREWDIERTLELNASLVALAGVILAATVNKRWLLLPGLVTAFLAQHAIQGWCPPIPLFRRLGVRTQKEIDAEKHALLKVLEAK